MITAELSVGSQKTIKKEDTTEEIFGYFGINVLDNIFHYTATLLTKHADVLPKVHF